MDGDVRHPRVAREVVLPAVERQRKARQELRHEPLVKRVVRVDRDRLLQHARRRRRRVVGAHVAARGRRRAVGGRRAGGVVRHLAGGALAAAVARLARLHDRTGSGITTRIGLHILEIFCSKYLLRCYCYPGAGFTKPLHLTKAGLSD